MTPTTPLTPEEIAYLRSVDLDDATLNRARQVWAAGGSFALQPFGHDQCFHLLPHAPTGGVALAMLRDALGQCSADAVLLGGDAVVPVGECQ